MPTLNLQVPSGGYDASEDQVGVVTITESVLLNLDTADRWNILGFTGVTIPESVTVISAYLRVYLATATQDEPDILIYAEDAAAPAAVTTTLNDISDRTKTTANVAWLSEGLGTSAAWYSSPDIKTVIQELVDSYAPYVSGQINLMLTSRAGDAAHDLWISTYESSPSLAAQLIINYSAGDNASPTVTPDTGNGSVFSTATPGIEFTGSDPDGDSLSYEIRISNNAYSWTDGEAISDTNTSASSNTVHPNPMMSGLTWDGNIPVDDRPGQSFRGGGGLLTKASFKIGSDADTDGYALVRVYAHQGVYGSTSAPLNPAEPAATPTPGWLAQSEAIHITTADPGTPEWYDFDFLGINQIILEKDTPYVLIIDWLPVDRIYTNTIEILGDVTLAHLGNCYIDGASEANNGVRTDFDMQFRVYEDTQVIAAASDTDAGFVNTSYAGDTDPFSSGARIRYTLQESLANGYYYWQARVTDPDGVGEWSAWSSARMFLVSAGPGDTTPPTAVITPASFSGSAPLTVNVSGASSTDNVGVTSYTWNWGDGSANSTGVTASHAYATAGSYTITLTAADAAGNTGQRTATVTVGAADTTAPVAVISPASFSGVAPLTINVSGASSTDNVGVVSYSWDWDDGSPDSGGITSSHTYATAGTYSVTLTVADAAGNTDTQTAAVTVSNDTVNPVAVITPASLSGVAPFYANVSGASSTDNVRVVSYSWDWGDGSTDSTGVSANHTYTAAGGYTITLTVADAAGNTDIETIEVSVTADTTDPVAAITPASFSGAAPFGVHPSGAGSTDNVGIASYSWNWGDGTANSSGVAPSHTYMTQGSYTITLTVTDPSGNTDTQTAAVTVSAPVTGTDFRIATSDVTYEPSAPPLNAWPTVNNNSQGSFVRHPAPTRKTGNGLPAGIIGKPWAVIGRHKIDLTGAAFYNDLFSDDTAVSQYVKVRLFDPHSGAWRIYGGIIARPEYGSPVPGRAYTFSDFKLVVTELEELGDWSDTYP